MSQSGQTDPSGMYAARSPVGERALPDDAAEAEAADGGQLEAVGVRMRLDAQGVDSGFEGRHDGSP